MMRIVPTNRLIVFTGLICVPASLAGAMFPTLGLAGYGLIGLFAATVVLDLMASRGSLKGIEVRTEDVVRLSRGRNGLLPLTVYHPETGGSDLRIGMVFPPHLSSEHTEKTVAIHPEQERTPLAFSLTGSRQGKYHLESCFLERLSRAGFWAVRDQRDLDCEVRVYPDLSSERRSLAGLFLSRGGGMHARRLLGKGREFEKLREYVPGDNYEDIHWKATARRGTPISKVFQVERTQDIYVMIDASRMSSRNAAIFQAGHVHDEKRLTNGHSSGRFPGESILERYISSTLAMAQVAEKQGDRFGVGVFAETMLGFVRSGSGKAHYGAIRDTLYTARPHRVSPDFSEFFTFTGTRLRKRALLIILTSLDDPVLSETFLKHVHILTRRHLVIVNMLRPASAHPLFSGDPVEGIDDMYQNLSGHMTWSRLRELEKSLRQQGAGFHLLSHAGLSMDLISQYLSIKQRQAL